MDQDLGPMDQDRGPYILQVLRVNMLGRMEQRGPHSIILTLIHQRYRIEVRPIETFFNKVD